MQNTKENQNVIYILDKSSIYAECFKPKDFPTYERFSCLQRSRFTRFVFRLLYKNSKIREKLFNQELKDCKGKTIIAFDTVGEIFINWLRKNNPNSRIIIYFINTIRNPDIVSTYKKNDCELWSFDPEDCKKFNLGFNDWYCCFQSNNSVKRLYDVVFIGREKTRRPILNKFEEYFRKNEIKFHFHVTHERNYLFINPFKYKHHISYRKMIEIEKKSLAMIEIVEPGQSGSTLRIMDSVFNNVKLITNFKSIINSPLYKKENIYVFDNDMSLDGLNEFLSIPFSPYDKTLLYKYSFENWISKFNI